MSLLSFQKPRIPTSSLIRLAGVLTSAVLLLSGACNLDRLGDCFMNRGQYQAAIPCYDIMTSTAGAVSPHHHRLADAWTNLGVCYLKTGRTFDAQQAQHIALEFRRQSMLADDAVASATTHGGMHR